MKAGLADYLMTLYTSCKRESKEFSNSHFEGSFIDNTTAWLHKSLLGVLPF